MTNGLSNCRIDFYIPTAKSADCQITLACRVTEKAFIAGFKIYLWCEGADQMEKIDKQLWTFSQCSFIPHKISDSYNNSVPVIIGESIPEDDNIDAVISIIDKPITAFKRFARVAEIVGCEDVHKSLARERFRFYRDNGVEPLTHEIEI